MWPARSCSTVPASSASDSAGIRSAASPATTGSTAARTSTMVRNGALRSCISSTTVPARWEASGSSSTGPPRGPGLSVITPWNSSSRSASRSVPRPVSYVASIARSGGSRSPGRSPPRTMSRTIRWATSIAAFGGRLPTVTERLLGEGAITLTVQGRHRPPG